MSSRDYKQAVVIDLEATCWDTEEEKAANTSEIIEIGVCLLNTETGEITAKRSIYVHPEKSKVSPFCEQLTGISQAKLDSEGIPFMEALQILKKEYRTKSRVMASFGNYDNNMFKNACAAHNFDNPFGPSYINLSALSALKLKADKKLSLKNALAGFGLEFEGNLHCGADDAYNAARILAKLVV